jgi:pyrrolidone-carboxylate peptidase
VTPPARKQKTVLLFGYSGQLFNQPHLESHSYKVAQKLEKRKEIEGYRIIALELPSNMPFSEVRDRIAKGMETYQPVSVVILGVYQGTSFVHLEKEGHNDFDPERYSGSGEDPGNSRLIKEGLEVYKTSFPVDNVCRKLLKKGIPVVPSDDAGRLGCNAAFYAALHQNFQGDHGAHVIFGHLPYTQEQAVARYLLGGVERPSISFDDQVRAMKLIIETWAKNESR